MKISVIAPYERPWDNVELVKECIIIPYLLQKNHGYDVTIVGKAPADISAGVYDEKDKDLLSGSAYPFYRYVSGLKFRLWESGEDKMRIKYLLEKSQDIDILYLRGLYDKNYYLAPLYKKLRPDGIVICALDANSSWMDRIYWYNPGFMEFMNSCDILTTSCTAMAEFLSIKWPWHIHSIINGFYDLSTNHKEKVSFDRRENIILTVGRLGTGQKKTEVLLEAFAKIADEIPDWKVYLVGNVDDAFKPYLDDFMKQNSRLKDRIIFTGPVYDRDDLADIYDRSKIYVLSSELEGGTNNATAEALGRGLVPVTTRIDAYEDITDHGNIGRSFEISDINALSGILVELCNDELLYKESEKVYSYAEKVYDMEKITDKLDGIIKGRR